MQTRAGMVLLAGLAVACAWATPGRSRADTSQGSDGSGGSQSWQGNSDGHNQRHGDSSAGNFYQSISGMPVHFTFLQNKLLITLQNPGCQSPHQ